MKKVFLMLVLLFSASAASAQTAVQHWQTWPADQHASFVSNAPNNTNAGDTIIAIITDGSGNCPLTDSQGNVWTPILQGFVSLCYASGIKGGPEVITVTYNPASYVDMIFAEYAGTWVFDQITGPHSGSGTSAVSFALSVSAGELLVGFGRNSTTNFPTITAGTGFTLENVANVFLEDSQTIAGSTTSSVTYGSSVNWTQYTASFKLFVPHLPLQISFPGSNGGTGFTALFPISNINQIPNCAPTDGVCSLSLLILDTNGNVVPTPSTGSVVIFKTFNGGTLTVPVIGVTP